MRRMSRRRKKHFVLRSHRGYRCALHFFFMGGPGAFRSENRVSDREGQAVFYPRAGEGRELQIQYLDAGQADATLIRLPNGRLCSLMLATLRLTGWWNIAKQGVKRIDFDRHAPP